MKQAISDIEMWEKELIIHKESYEVSKDEIKVSHILSYVQLLIMKIFENLIAK
jgi:hypothetical protein